jgi:hypothetical protein
MKLAVKIVGLALTATALCGLGIGAASGATAGGSQRSVASVNEATDSVTSVVAHTRYMNSLESVTLPAFACPADHPWLLNQDLSRGRLVPRGVVVDEPGGIGVSIFDAAGDAHGRAIGWRSGSATNWGFFRQTLTVSALCTDNPAAGYLS